MDEAGIGGAERGVGKQAEARALVPAQIRAGRTVRDQVATMVGGLCSDGRRSEPSGERRFTRKGRLVPA